MKNKRETKKKRAIKLIQKPINEVKRSEVKWSEFAQSCPTLCDPMECSLPGFSVHGIFKAIVLEWIAISFSRGSSQPRDWTQVSRIVDRCFTVWATREVPGKKRKRDLLNRFWGRILQVSYRGLFIQQIYLWTLSRRIGGGCWAHTNCMIKISGDMYEAWEETCVGHLTRLETDEP